MIKGVLLHACNYYRVRRTEEYPLHGLMGMAPSADQFEYFCGGSGPLADGICVGPNTTHFLPRPDLRVRLRQLFLCGRDKYVQPKLAISSLVFVAVA